MKKFEFRLDHERAECPRLVNLWVDVDGGNFCLYWEGMPVLGLPAKTGELALYRLPADCPLPKDKGGWLKIAGQED